MDESLTEQWICKSDVTVIKISRALHLAESGLTTDMQAENIRLNSKFQKYIVHQNIQHYYTCIPYAFPDKAVCSSMKF